MHRIVFLDRSTIAPQVRLRRPAIDHQWVEHERTSPDQVLARLMKPADKPADVRAIEAGR